MTPSTELMPVTEERHVVITDDQVALIKRTIAADASDAELQLFFFDCRRRGVHPLDKLIHFTKRAGKYTPVTSIDFFRARASATNEHMGTEDATFVGAPGDPHFAATVVVYRMVQNEKCPFTATARFVEYVPDSDFMWKKMPYAQIAKCAEALALRKAFPHELADLHTFEEMDQIPERDVKRASQTGAAPLKRLPVDKSTTKTLTTPPRKVRDVRDAKDSKDKPFWVLTLDGDAADYTTRNAAQGEELRKFKGTDHQIRVSYVENEWQGKTYRNIETFTIVDGALDKAPMAASDIPFGG